MRTVEDGSGRKYVLVKQSADTSLVRDVETGRERYVPTEELSVVDGTDPLEAAALAVPDPVRQLVTAVPDRRALGFLVALSHRGPLSVRDLLDTSALCERDLHGLTGELRAAGLIEEALVDGERGYRLTDDATAAVAVLEAAEPDG